MKLGCASWVYSWDSPYDSAIESIGKLKFKGTELIATRETDLAGYYTRERIAKLIELCGSYGLTISEFALAGGFWWDGGLSSYDKEEKKRAIGQFTRGVQIAKELGTGIICFVSHWPIGIKTPIPYPPSYLYPSRGGYPQSSHSPKLTIELPEGFSWDRTWENYVESIGMCTDIAREGGLLLAIEGHLHVIAGTTDSFLRLYDAVKSNSLGMNYDTGWQFIQREYIPISIHKLGKRLLHMHIRDGDGILHYNLPPGQGIIDWDEVVKALKDIGYGGFLSFELGYDENEKWLSEGREYLERTLRKHKALD
jgi:sugar phosphate isomerase/epimerase